MSTDNLNRFAHYDVVHACGSDAAPIERLWLSRDRQVIEAIKQMADNLRIHAIVAIPQANFACTRADLEALLDGLHDLMGDTIGAWIKVANEAEIDAAPPVSEYESERVP